MIGTANGRKACVLASSAALLAVIVTASITEIDFFLSDLVYDETASAWPLSHDAGWARLALYDGAKILIGGFGLYLLSGMAWPVILRPLALRRSEARYLVLCLAVVPLVVATVKYQSGVECAGELMRYGGYMPDSRGHFTPARLLDSGSVGGCWPSGHASGGYALLALGFLGGSRRKRALLRAGAAAAGTAMGAYQVARGAHFVSHVLVTALLAQLLVCVLAGWSLRRHAARGHGGPPAGPVRIARRPPSRLVYSSVRCRPEGS